MYSCMHSCTRRADSHILKKIQTQCDQIGLHRTEHVHGDLLQKAEEEQATNAADALALKEQQDATIKRVLESQLELDEE